MTRNTIYRITSLLKWCMFYYFIFHGSVTLAILLQKDLVQSCASSVMLSSLDNIAEMKLLKDIV